MGGETSGPHSFDANSGLAMLPGNSLIHFDYQDQRFHVLALNGKPVRSFGRKGGGPEETDEATGFAISPAGDILVNDRGNERFSRFDASGTFLKSVPVRWQYTLGVRWDAGFLDDGRLLESYTTAADSLGVRVFLDRARLWSEDLTTFDDIDTRSCMVSPRPAAGHTTFATFEGADAIYGLLPLPFSGPWLATAVDQAGYIWGMSSLQDSLKLAKFPVGRCEAVLTIALPDNAPAIPAAIADSAREALAGFAQSFNGAVPPEATLPARFPQFWTLHVDDHHRLWVQRFGSAGERVMEVYDSTGAAVARVDSFPLEPRWPMVFHDGRIYGFAADEDGIKYLLAISIVR